MLSTLYPIGFTVSLVGLILWFYFQENRKLSRLMSTLFIGGFFVYLFSLAFSEGDFTYKLMVLFRDFIVLGLTTRFAGLFTKNKMAFLAVIVVLFGLFQFKYLSVLENTFPQHIASKSATMTNLDTEGELLVEVKESHQMKELERIINQYGLTYQKAFTPLKIDQTDLDDYVIVNVPDRLHHKLPEIESALLRSGLIDWVEENEVINIDPMEQQVVPYRTKLEKKYGINDPGLRQLWGFEEMQVDQLYKLLIAQKIKPERKASIFILDTGVDAGHEDIKANYKSLKTRYDKDPRGHGTHCAGIAASVSNNSKGIASFSPNNEFVSVTSITVLSAFGGGTQKGIIDGIIMAADNGADVISMSLGGPSNRSKQLAYEKAIQYAAKNGAIVIAAAGNSNTNAKDFAPANAPGAITVSAIDTTLNKASFSNYISDVTMGIAAPGVSIYSTLPDNKYANLNGTSMATPYVAGLVGLMKSIKPGLTTSEAYTILKNSGKQTKDTKLTGKLIQPAKAVEMLLESQ